MTAKFSLDKDKIKVLLLEGVNPNTVETFRAAGYTNITGLKADDGHWEGKGVKNGKIMEFHVDPRSGALTKEEIDD